MTRLREHYKNVVCKTLQEKFSYKNYMQIPKLDKVILNMGVGAAIQDKKKLQEAAADLAAITGQKPVFTKAHKSVASFKIREGMNIGCKVTLRRNFMYEFIDRLVNIALPRVRDFRGLNKKSFDQHGNFAMGLKEQFIFPEVEYDKADSVRGIDVVICTTAQSDNEALALLKAFDLPFQN